jgi:hypothetical protein
MVLSYSGHEEFERIELNDIPEAVVAELCRRAEVQGHSLSREMELIFEAHLSCRTHSTT